MYLYVYIYVLFAMCIVVLYVLLMMAHTTANRCTFMCVYVTCIGKQCNFEIYLYNVHALYTVWEGVFETLLDSFQSVLAIQNESL